jgi:hypothetical protein
LTDVTSMIVASGTAAKTPRQFALLHLAAPDHHQ